MPFEFYLGTHMYSWLYREDIKVPLFVSYRRLQFVRRLKSAVTNWALDSGGFTELNMFGEWRTSSAQYADAVRRLQAEVGNLDFVAPQDWMCEPVVLAKTRRTVSEHQDLTILNFKDLRDQLGPIVIPVLQGWTKDEYFRCVDKYFEAGVDLNTEPRVGIGSVCRRSATSEIKDLLLSLSFLKLHAFGVKKRGLVGVSDKLRSSDSLAWAYGAWKLGQPLPECLGGTHKNCANCFRYALKWRAELLAMIGTV